MSSWSVVFTHATPRPLPDSPAVGPGTVGTWGDKAPPRWADPWTRGHGKARVRSLMSRTWGEEPGGVWSDPGRVTAPT
ncbi:MAG: hypothetical protein ACK4MD_02790, partial [Demequina sp.]